MSSFFVHFESIHWGYYVLSLVLVYTLGALWHSKLMFQKTWTELYQSSESPENPEKSLVFFSMFFQFIATAFLILVFFLTVKISLISTILLSIAFLAWQKAALFFKYPQRNKWIKVATLEVGYLLCSLIIMLIFSLL